MIKLLLLDIETAPNLVHVWGLYNQNVATNQIVDAGYTICWAAKWYKSSRVFSSAALFDGEKVMLEKIHALLDEADIVITYNGSRFDLPTLNKEFIKHKMTPPAPYRQIDLLKTARLQFKFASNKLEYVTRFLGLGGKVKHRGHDMWKEAMEGNPRAVKEMLRYNIGDVKLLEKVYTKMLPWIKNHPNLSVMKENVCCPNCGSKQYTRRGYAYTNSSKFARFVCNSCGRWFRSAVSYKRQANRIVGVS